MIILPIRDLILPRGNILVPRLRDIIAKPLNYMDPMAVLRSRLRGRFKMDVVRSDGTIRMSTGWFDNLITNGGLDLIGSSTAYTTFCHVGTGSATPANTDTGLQTWLAATSTLPVSATNVASGISPYAGSWTATYRFAAGTATGNISEVGIGSVGSNTGMFSHALVLDSGGSPTTITVLASEALDVTYQLNNYPPLVDVGGSVVISSVTYTTNMRAANAGGSNWSLSSGVGNYPENLGVGSSGGSASISCYSTATLGALTTVPSGTGYGTSTTPTLLTYTASNYYRDAQVNFALGDGNAPSGIGSIRFEVGTRGSAAGHLGSFQCSFSPVIPKDSSHVMMLVIRHTVARYP